MDAVGARKHCCRRSASARIESAEAAAAHPRGRARRASTLATADEVNAYFASDAMVGKLRDIAAEMGGLGDAVKADELEARLKAARQDALRGQRDRADLFEGAGELIRFGEHRFPVNAQPLELMIVPHDGGLAVHLAGTDFYESIGRGLAEKNLWQQDRRASRPTSNARVPRAQSRRGEAARDGSRWCAARGGARGHARDKLAISRRCPRRGGGIRARRARPRASKS